MEKNEFTEKRFIDLSNQASIRNIVTFSDFLTLNETAILKQNRAKYPTEYELYGGYESAERQMAAFIPDALCYEWDYPMTVLHLTPRYPKFAEKLSHRDVLGAAMSLGIERHLLGDILVKDTDIYLICEEKITPVITDELSEIRHTVMDICVLEPDKLSGLAPELEEKNGIISSNRLDNVVACICGLSRNESAALIRAGKVFIGGLESMNVVYSLKPEDLISVRGYGKFRFKNISGETKKGRMKMTYEKFI